MHIDIIKGIIEDIIKSICVNYCLILYYLKEYTFVTKFPQKSEGHISNFNAIKLSQIFKVKLNGK